MYANVNRIIYAAVDVCFLYIQKPYIFFFSNFRINNNRLVIYPACEYNTTLKINLECRAQSFSYTGSEMIATPNHFLKIHRSVLRKITIDILYF